MFDSNAPKKRLTALTFALTLCGWTLAGQQPQKPAPPTQKPAPSTQKPAAPAAEAPGEQLDVVLAKILAPWTGDLNGMIERRYIRVGTAYNRTQFFIDKGVQRGTVAESAKLFEDELNARLKLKNVRVHVVFVPMSREEQIPALLAGRVDLLVGGHTVTEARQKQVDFSNPVKIGVDEIVVTGPGAPKIATVDDLAGQEVFVRPTSSYHEHLVTLNADFKKRGLKPIILKDAPENLESDDLLEMVNAGLVKITVVDNYLAEFWAKILPKITPLPAVAVSKGGVLAVAMRKNSPQLQQEVNGWIKRHGPRTLFGNTITQRYLQKTNFAKSATAKAEMDRFTKVIELFRKYGDKYDMDFLLMAAQGFQESGLDQNVKSQVGAIGVMQIMPATGKELAVGDITQLESNIHGGVKYMRQLVDKNFGDQPMDRLNKGLFAFAAYNAGPGRIRQLQREAEKRGLNPNVWFNNVEQIASERIGRETCTYVSNIFKYYVAYRLAMEEMQQRKKTTF